MHPPVHYVRANCRSPVHGDQKGRPAREVRPPEGAGRSVEGVRKASGEHGAALRVGQPGGIEGQRFTGPGDIYYKYRRILDGESPRTRQDRLRTIRVGVSGFSGRTGVLQRAEASDAAENAVAWIPCNLNDFKTSLKIGL